MEDRQLDFNQPLLSVRRFSSTVASEKDVKRKTDNSRPNLNSLPFYRSELKSGPVRNPGTVPFTWEQSPGRPKDESRSRTRALEGPPIIPKLPPGRIMKDKGSEDSSVTRSEAGKVPSSSQCVSTVEENKKKFESSKGAIEEKESSSDSGEGEEEYLDALDTLSRTESFFLNCSLSGLSGLDGPEAKPSGIFSADPQTRDFMMGRFLPAAKAMASETPQYAPRKQPVAREQPRQMMKVTSGVKKPPLYRSRPNISLNYTDDKGEEIDDEDDDYDDPGNLSTKVCGLLPRFCFLNPVPNMSVRLGTSVRTRVPRSPYSGMQARSSSQCQETHKNEHIRVAKNEQISDGGPQKTELHEYKNAVRNKNNQLTHQSSAQKFEGSSLCRRLQGGVVSFQQSELPQLSFYKEKGFPDIPKQAEVDQSTKREISSASPVVEKTLYVDSVQKVASPKLNSFSPDMKGLPKCVNNDLEIIAKVGGLEEAPSVNYLLKDIEKTNVIDEEGILQPKILNPADSSLLSFSGKSDHKGLEMVKGFGQDQGLLQESMTSASLKLSSSGCLDVKDQHHLTKVENEENFQEIDSRFPLPPPLPKSPSESWLYRTLPSMSSKNSSPRSYLSTRLNSHQQASGTPSADPKWETVVKTAKVQPQH